MKTPCQTQDLINTPLSTVSSGLQDTQETRGAQGFRGGILRVGTWFHNLGKTMFGFHDPSLRGAMQRSHLGLVAFASGFFALAIAALTWWALSSLESVRESQVRLEESVKNWQTVLSLLDGANEQQTRRVLRLIADGTVFTVGLGMQEDSNLTITLPPLIDIRIPPDRIVWVEQGQVRDPKTYAVTRPVPTHWLRALKGLQGTHVIVPEASVRSNPFGSSTLILPARTNPDGTRSYLAITSSFGTLPRGSAFLIAFVVLLVVAVLTFVPLASVVILVGSWLSRRAARRIAAPLEGIAATARQIAQGNLDVRATPDGPLEVQALARNINTIGENLGSSLGELAQAKTRAEALLEAQRNLTVNISHDLRTPLSSILAYSEALEVNPHRTAHARVIHREAQALKHLVDDLFDLSRLETPGFSLELHPTDIHSLLHSATESLAPAAWRKGVLVRVHAPDAALPQIWADAQRLDQVLRNLIVNAVRHTPEGGLVELGVQHKTTGDSLEITVSDTGEGIPAEHLPRIFDRFYRADPSRTDDDDERHTGLGLSIARQLVERMHGSILVESQPGEGTTFTLRFLAVGSQPRPR